MSTLMPVQNSERPHSPAPVQHRDENLADFQHQVKNLMAIVRAMAHRTVEYSSNLGEFLAHFDGRLTSLARTQRMLARAGTFEIDLEELVREELLTHTLRDPVTVHGPGIRLTQRAAETLGLAIHELTVNAVKFGALSGSGGQLSVTWTVDDGGLRLEWRECGVTAVEVQPSRSGFGREWIEKGVPYQLRADARLEILPEGAVCTIAIPRQFLASGSQ